ncbi:LysR family transcriptional regulator [Saccharopolyspora griseoalba]|uniref:LysR substrate-binding domain-containing protein n=1 Tax=Saccharopolyspora griseoalba TaxID=1431848 RepID=A0ABW2LMD0_9PSEU
MTHESSTPREASQLAAHLAPTLSLLRTVAAEGHLTRAAERLGQPQPTVSRALAGLADQLGTPVVAKQGRGVVLTRVGALLCEAAENALRELETGCRGVLDELDPNRGQVLLGFQHTMGRALIPRLISEFREHNPGVRFGLAQGSRDDMLARSRAGRVDLCLVSPVPSDPEWESAQVTQEELVAVVHSGHRLAGRGEIRLTELAEDDFVGMRPGYGLRRIVTDLAESAGFTPRFAWEGEEVDTARGLVAAGLGTTLLPRALSGAAPGTAEIPLSPPAHRTIGVVWPAGRQLPPAVRAFRDHASGIALG